MRFIDASALGADAVEALRGKMLAELRAGLSPEITAEQLASALLRYPSGKALAIAALEIAADRWLDKDNARAAAAAQRARALAEGAGLMNAGLATSLELIESRAIVLKDPAKAKAMIDAILARDRSSREAWNARVAIAAIMGDSRASDDATVEGALACGCPELTQMARSIRKARGESVPVSTAGELAADLAESTFQGGLPPAVMKQRGALSPDARDAFDAAAVAILKRANESEEAGAAFLFACLREASERAVSTLFAVALEVEFSDAVLLEAVGLRPSLAGRTVGFAVTHGRAVLARKILTRIAASLARSDGGRLERELTRGPFMTLEADLQALEQALAPDFSLSDFLDDADVLHDVEFPAMLLAKTCAMIGVQAAALQRVSPSMRSALEADLVRITKQPPDQRAARDLAQAFSRAGLSPRGFQ